MKPLPRRPVHGWPAPILFSAAVLAIAGCASPGPPRPPTLGIPKLVSDLTATRTGDTVVLRFTVPARTTDGQPVKAATLSGSLCRQIGSSGPCTPLQTPETRTALAVPAASPAPAVVWRDDLPPALRSGAPRAIAYRIELKSPGGRTAGLSDPAFAAAGVAPPDVAGFRAEGMRLGVELRWAPVADGGEVLLNRTDLESAAAPTPATPDRAGQTRPSRRTKERSAGEKAAKPSHASGTVPGLVILQAAPGNASPERTVDKEIAAGTPYRYTAFRRRVVQIGGRTLELRSADSPSVTVTWRDVYPPAAPTALAALGYEAPSKSGSETKSTPDADKSQFAVDLVWQPVNDTRLAGYVVYRQALDPAGVALGSRQRLIAEPVLTPGYHDPAALPGYRYRYSVTAVDPAGNESPAVETVVESTGP